ncbi:MAG: phosphoenolpyruvate carboxykinase [Chloroflexi bacterium]|nr:phosphoenolpyruvate carboxykinase [Chloroflexota bacterium]
MQQIGQPSPYGLEMHGIQNTGNVYWNLSTPALYEQAVRHREGLIAHLGPLVVRTGQYTGRSPKDKFVVKERSSEDKIWWGSVNQPFAPDRFERLYHRLLAYVQGRDLFVQDMYVGADPAYRIPIRVITEHAWQSLFARNMFIRPDRAEIDKVAPQFTVLVVPNFHAVPDLDGTKSEVFIVVNFERKLILIGGTAYAGEIKKSLFTILNYLLPLERVLSMHCSANQGPKGDVALFFGLSGTGKTSLSSDPARTLIGDDEHGWSDRGVFNFEGGCYAKAIRLSKKAEPEIYEATRKFGTLLENVAIDTLTRRIDLDDSSLTENTRAAYPISHIANATRSGMGGHPSNIMMLTADAFGIMPPIAKLTPDQAMYHFLSGYTAKVAGTERGLGAGPEATFSTCFGAPFLVLHPSVYAKLLGEKIDRHKARSWLVSTGWVGGPYGVGSRIKIAYTRAMVHAALQGLLDQVPTRKDPVFGLEVPLHVPDVPDELLWPRDSWSDADAYDQQARMLAEKFKANFKQFEDQVSDAVKASGPSI